MLRSRFRDEVRRLVSNIPLQDHKKKSIEDTINRIVMRGLPKNEEISEFYPSLLHQQIPLIESSQR